MFQTLSIDLCPRIVIYVSFGGPCPICTGMSQSDTASGNFNILFITKHKRVRFNLQMSLRR